MRCKHPLLLARGQPGIEGQQLGLAAPTAKRQQRMLFEELGHLENVALRGQEHEDVAGTISQRFFESLQNRFRPVGVTIFVKHRRRTVLDIDRVRPPRHLQHRGRDPPLLKMVAEPRGIDRGRGDDQFEVAPSGQQLGQRADQKIDIERPLVRFVENEGVVPVEKPVGLTLAQQDPIGHQLDQRLGSGRIGEPNLETDLLSQRDVQLLRDPSGHAPCRDPAGLRMPDDAVHPPARFQTDQRQLGRLPRPRLPADD